MGRHHGFAGVDEDELRRKYIDENKPMHTVADELGVAVGTVYNYLKKYNIQSRKTADYPITDKQRQAGRRAWEVNRGRKLSIETRRKISLARIKGGIGHKKQRADGYIAVYFPDHPRSSTDGYIMEHILVMEALIGRHLEADECVHHINGVRDDNRKENLKLMTKKEHMSYHMKKRYEEKRRNDLSTQ